MPEWVREVVIGLAAFVGGKAVNAAGEQIKEGRELRRGVDRLAIAVESISKDLREIRGEIHDQVSGLKTEMHEQVGAMLVELNNYKAENETRMQRIESRIDQTGQRVDRLVECFNRRPGEGGQCFIEGS
jgi:hypothetical protein